MCRWLAYSGEAIHPSTLVLDTKHSLVAQSMNSPLGAETVNGDGFGLGWYPIGGDATGAPAMFHSIEPAWWDENLREIASAVHTERFFAHVRAAAGPPIQQTNCHPFRHSNWLFMHNGSLSGFHKMRRDLMIELDPELFPLVKGTTDSEVLFYLAVTYGLEQDPIAAIGRAIRHVEEIGQKHGIAYPMQGTIAATDGETVWAFRYSTSGRSRTLFYSVDIPSLREMYPDFERLDELGETARVVVSEPLSDLPGAFVEVPESTVVILSPGGGFEQQPFLRELAVV